MSKVKVLYVRNLTQDTSEEKLKVGIKSDIKLLFNLLIFKNTFSGTFRGIWKGGESEKDQRLRLHSF